jgi:hypothetical protein
VIVHYIVYSVIAALSRDTAPVAADPDASDEHTEHKVADGQGQNGRDDTEHRDAQ